MSALKELAARAAASEVAPGMVVGLGTGSTAAFAIRRLGERIRDEGLAVRGIPTSIAAELLARQCGIAIATFEDVDRIDLTIDGADEVDPGLRLLKGGGGALLREKVVARQSSRVAIVVDEAKLVARLGTGFALPVEVVPFAWRPVASELARLGGTAAVRRPDGREPFVTDNGNWILDVRFPDGIADPPRLERDIDAVPGVVESGLFVGLAHAVYVGREAGVEVLAPPPGG